MNETPVTDHPVLLFDGVCNLCSGSVRFVIERDPDGEFSFAPLQSDVASDLLAGCDLPDDHMASFVLVEADDCYSKSDAALRVASHLGGVYRLLAPLKYVPRFLRDAVYDLVAANRYRLFGKRDTCMRPTPDLEDRFLAGDPRPAGDPRSDGTSPSDGRPGD